MQCMNQEGSRFGGEPTSLIKQSYTKKMTMDIQSQDNFWSKSWNMENDYGNLEPQLHSATKCLGV